MRAGAQQKTPSARRREPFWSSPESTGGHGGGFGGSPAGVKDWGAILEDVGEGWRQDLPTGVPPEHPQLLLTALNRHCRSPEDQVLAQLLKIEVWRLLWMLYAQGYERKQAHDEVRRLARILEAALRAAGVTENELPAFLGPVEESFQEVADWPLR